MVMAWRTVSPAHRQTTYFLADANNASAGSSLPLTQLSHSWWKLHPISRGENFGSWQHYLNIQRFQYKNGLHCFRYTIYKTSYNVKQCIPLMLKKRQFYIRQHIVHSPCCTSSCAYISWCHWGSSLVIAHAKQATYRTEPVHKTVCAVTNISQQPFQIRHYHQILHTFSHILGGGGVVGWWRVGGNEPM